jgi:uncharacterized protein with PQ loop repeat
MINFLLNLLPSIAGILLGICYVPQIVTTIKTKDVSGMNLWFWIILVIALLMLTTNAFVIFLSTSVWGYFLTECFNSGLAIVMLTLVIKYRKRQKKAKIK